MIQYNQTIKRKDNMPNYQAIGEFAVEKSKEYERAVKVHSQLVHQRYELDKKIQDAELNQNTELLVELYKQFRILKRDQQANASFRQKFCDDFLFEIAQMAKETNNEQ